MQENSSVISDKFIIYAGKTA